MNVEMTGLQTQVCVGPLHNGRMAVVVSGLLIWPKYALSQHLEQRRRRRLHTEIHALHNSWRLIKELRPLLLRAVVLNHRHDAHSLIFAVKFPKDIADG